MCFHLLADYMQMVLEMEWVVWLVTDLYFMSLSVSVLIF